MIAATLHRWFGIGGVSKAMRPILQQEGLVLLEEGLAGSITLRRFKSPSRRSGYGKSAFIGYLAITGLRVVAFSFFRPVLNVALDHPSMASLYCSLEGSDVLLVEFEAADFQEDASGSVALRFHTPQARQFLEQLLHHASPGPRP